MSGENQKSFGSVMAMHLSTSGLVLHHLVHVIVQPGPEAHLSRGFADLVECLAHGLERVVDHVLPARREDDQVLRAKSLKKFHRLAGILDHFVLLRRVVRGAAEGNRDDLHLPLEASRSMSACVILYLSRICGNCVNRIPMKPVSRITSRISVNGTGGNEFQRFDPSAHLTFLFSRESGRRAGQRSR